MSNSDEKCPNQNDDNDGDPAVNTQGNIVVPITETLLFAMGLGTFGCLVVE